MMGMIARQRCDSTGKHRDSGRFRAFTLIELLTVMFIISLLIGLLIPALNAARNAAKKTATKATFNAIGVGMDMFKTDNGKGFARTNGYPPSFAHPPIGPKSNRAFNKQESRDGKFPFIQEKPRVYGAHWLPAMLMGVDSLGYIKRKSVPKKDNLNQQPWKWYEPPPIGPDPGLARMPFYLDPNGTKVVRTEKLAGRPNMEFFPDWEKMKHLPVIVDDFSQPILYYAAQANGRTTNMVEDEINEKNDYSGGTQEKGPPIYFHQDNHGFTGSKSADGWDLGTGLHAIAIEGDALTAADITEEANRDTFARFILDRKQYDALRVEESTPPEKPLTPVNSDTYLLISAGVDGLYGTNDDITNFPTDVE